MTSQIISKESVFNTLNAGSTTPTYVLNNFFNPVTDYIETHIENGGNLIKSHYNYSRYILSRNVGIANNKYPSVDIDPISDLTYYGYVSGEYTVTYNFFRKIFSTTLDKSFFIKDISPSRREIRLASNTLTPTEIETNFNNLTERVNSVDYVSNLLLNIPGNIQGQIINIAIEKTSNNYTIKVKLDDPLVDSVGINDLCWVVEGISLSTKYVIDLVSTLDEDTTTAIKGPNFNIGVNNKTSYTTNYSNLSTLNSISDDNALAKLLKVVSDKKISINVDYTEFRNFIHFSSAVDRINTFIDKVSLIEDIDLKISSLSNVSSSLQAQVDIKKLQDEKNAIISHFDGYETFLYFEYDEKSYPKVNSNKPYILQPTSIITSWYEDIIAEAERFDSGNDDYIWDSLPMYITKNEDNYKLKLFVDALGHYYDNIWIYIKSLETVYHANNNTNIGISKDLVREMLISFGVNLYNDSTETDLDKDLVGNNTGILAIDNLDIIPIKEYNQEIYKRIYHNLPLLLKSKGTLRNVRTLLSIYGIPSELLSIDTRISSFASELPKTISTKVSALKVGPEGYLNVPWVRNGGTHTIQFSILPNGNTGVVMSLGANLTLSISYINNNQTVRYTLTSFGTPINLDVPNDNTFNTVFIRQLSNIGYFDVSSGFSKVNATFSLSDANWATFDSINTIDFGKVSNGSSYIYGFKLFSTSATDQTIQRHIDNPFNKVGNDYGQLHTSLFLGLDNKIPTIQKSAVSYTQVVWRDTVNSIYGINTVPYKAFTNINAISSTVIFASFVDMNDDVDGVYVVTDVTNFNDDTKDAVSEIFKSFTIRRKTQNVELITRESNVTDNLLSIDVKQDKYASNNDLVDISISKSKDINKDILDYFYGKNINDYFGNPGDLYSDSYTNIELLRSIYFKYNPNKYTNNDYILLAKYINTSVFKMINEFTPISSTVITGVSVQPLITDRSKFQYKRSEEVYENDFDFLLPSVEIESGPSMDIDVEDSKGLYNGDLKGTTIPVNDITENVGANKYITNLPTNATEFNKSLDNVLYGNVHKNKIYEFQDPNATESGSKLYKLTNPWVTNQFVWITPPGTKTGLLGYITRGVGAESTLTVCSTTTPVVLPSSAPSQYRVTVEILNPYGCDPNYVPKAKEEIEFQEYYTNLSSFTLPRYDGSKVLTKTINEWSIGDLSYGKSPGVESYVNQIGLFARAYSSSIGSTFSNLTLKYLVNRDGSFTELNELNRNLFDVQNLFRIEDTATISLFNPLEFSNQKNTNGVKKIFSSGYYYKPIFYYTDKDESIKFETDDDDLFARFSAMNNLNVVTHALNPSVITSPAILNNVNSYDIYNFFDFVNYNSYNSYVKGSTADRKFPAYTIVDGSMKYSFTSNFKVFVNFGGYNQPVKYSFDVVKSDTNEQKTTDKVLKSTIVTFQPGYMVIPEKSEKQLILRRSLLDIGEWINFDKPIFDDTNNIEAEPNRYKVYLIPSELVTPPDDPGYDYYEDKFWLYYIQIRGIFYQTGQGWKGQYDKSVLSNLVKAENNIVRTLALKTDWLEDLDVNNTVYFRLRKLDKNPTETEFIMPFGALYVDIEIDEKSGGLIPAIESIVNTDTIVFNESVSKYYGFVQTPTNEDLVKNNGIIEGPFTVKRYDIINIKHKDSTKRYTFIVNEAFINADNKLVVKVEGDLPANVIYGSDSITEFVISSRSIDETNVILSFRKADGDTSYGILIPKNIDPDYMDNIDTVMKEIKQKLINENIRY